LNSRSFWSLPEVLSPGSQNEICILFTKIHTVKNFGQNRFTITWTSKSYVLSLLMKLRSWKWSNSVYYSNIARSVIKKAWMHFRAFPDSQFFSWHAVSKPQGIFIYLSYEMSSSLSGWSGHSDLTRSLSDHGEAFRGNLGYRQMSEDSLEWVLMLELF